ncbi:MAG: hypothetical protein R3C03_16035 [Pirellulaceae bacterium]
MSVIQAGCRRCVLLSFRLFATISRLFRLKAQRPTLVSALLCRFLNRPFFRLQELPDSLTWRGFNANAPPQTDTVPIFYLDVPGQKARHSIDHDLIFNVDWVKALAVKANGNIAKAISQRLRKPCVETSEPESNASIAARTWLRTDSKSNDSKTIDTLLAYGATPWILTERSSTNAPPTPEKEHTLQHNSFKSLPTWLVDGHYLVHCTRATRIAPSYLVECDSSLLGLLLSESIPLQGPVRTLIQILVSRRLIATNQLTSGRRPVVCFSAKTLDEVKVSRVYRKHLGRWDFEPFGVAIEQSQLESKGARPVTYVDEPIKAESQLFDLAFQQPKSSIIGNQTIDWTDEKEWRMFDDVDLSQFSPEAMIVFVPDLETAKLVQTYSRWPVFSLDSIGE